MGHVNPGATANRPRQSDQHANWRLWLRPGLGELGAALLAGALASAISYWCGLPTPAIHDEFSYLLAAETFASGNVTAPPHPNWIHFESFHILQQPTCSSKYPPGQGLLLAAGWRIFGHPAAGAWLGAALSSAAVCWMLRGWTTPRWAVFGGVVAATHPEVLAWSQTYEGAHVAIMGAAILLGALRRIAGRRPARNAALMALGCFLLFISRPFEGLVLAAISALWLSVRAFWDARLRRALFSIRVWIALMTVALPSGVAIAYHNARVTNNPARLPYAAYQDTYGYSPIFLWQTIGPVKAYRHDIMRDFYIGWEADAYRALHTPDGFVKGMPNKLLRFLQAVFGCWLPFLPLFAPFWTARPSRFALVAIGGVFCAILAVPWLTPQYAAPAIPLGCLTIISWMRAAAKALARHRLSVAPLLVLAIGGSLTNAGTGAIAAAVHRPVWAIHRTILESTLERLGGKHLILVRYGAGHSPHEEWVYNHPDIDRAHIVWARAIQPTADSHLIESMPDRKPWLLMPDESGGPALIPY
ncbi:MAG TPA: hypothetical protein PLU30_10480 [Verrucomicrobiae bacterium]|nr:hypothetical protein [Verrucomicrobiae bacterium]